MNDRAVRIIQSSVKEFLSEKDPIVTEVNCPMAPRKGGGWLIMNPSITVLMPDKKRTIRIEVEGVWDDE